MRVGIFGGTGFIGRHLVERLSASGVEIRVFGGPKSVSDNAAIIPIDIEKPSTYRERLESLDVLVLLVSQSSPTRLESTPVSEIEENVLPHALLLELIEKSEVQHVVYLSSGGTVYGLQDAEPIDETHPTVPLSYYGLGKLLIEKTLVTGLSRLGRSLTILRPSNPVGTLQELASIGFVARAVASVMAGSVLEVWGDGSVVRDHFAVLDLCTAIESSILNKAARGQTFNVSSGIGLSLNQIIEKISSLLGREVNVSYRAGRAVDLPVNILSPKKTETMLGWRTTKTFDEIVLELAAHLAHRPEIRA